MTNKMETKQQRLAKLEAQHTLTVSLLKEYISNRRVQLALWNDGFPIFLKIELLRFEGGAARIFCGGRCAGYKSLYLRNICMVQFVDWNRL